MSSNDFHTSITVTLSVRNSARAIDFYKEAFRATELYRVPSPKRGYGLIYCE
jgi:uncharacterized glyoxalase superfamily protein PhnB